MRAPGYSPQRIELDLKLKEDAAKIDIEIDVVYPSDWPSTERMSYIEKDFNIFANYVTADPARWVFSRLSTAQAISFPAYPL